MSKLPVNDKTPRTIESLRDLITDFLPSAFPIISDGNGEILICTGLAFNQVTGELESLDVDNDQVKESLKKVENLLNEVLNATKGTTRMHANEPEVAPVKPSDDEFIN